MLEIEDPGFAGWLSTARQVLLYWSQVVHSKWKSRTNSEKRVFQAEHFRKICLQEWKWWRVVPWKWWRVRILLEFSQFRNKKYQESKAMTGTGAWIGTACVETSRRLGLGKCLEKQMRQTYSELTPQPMTGAEPEFSINWVLDVFGYVFSPATCFPQHVSNPPAFFKASFGAGGNAVWSNVIC